MKLKLARVANGLFRLFMGVTEIIIYLCIGTIAGFLGGLLGISGGVITIPCLLFLFRQMEFPQLDLMRIVLGTSLAAMVLSSFVSTLMHQMHKGILWSCVLHLAPGILTGACLGTYLAQTLSTQLLQTLFGSFLLLLAVFFFFKKKHKRTSRLSFIPISSFGGFLIGVLASLLGIGGGTLSFPLLISKNYSEKQASATSSPISLFISFVAALGYLIIGIKERKIEPNYLGYIYLPAFTWVSISTALFAPIGTKLVYHFQSQNLRKLFGLVVLLTGIGMVG